MTETHGIILMIYWHWLSSRTMPPTCHEITLRLLFSNRVPSIVPAKNGRSTPLVRSLPPTHERTSGKILREEHMPPVPSKA
jgi:hypothetical protein